MEASILVRDVDLRFPHLILLRASAGSGKTYALAERFVQFILSEKIPQNHLRNILAITFSNNAAKEMKERILSWLKEISFGDMDKLHQLSQILSLDENRLVRRADALIDEILLNYTDFQVKTIDSFMTSIYRASAIDLGYSPDFDILMDKGPVLAYAFNRFLRRVRPSTPEAHFLEELLGLISEGRGAEASYLWDPSKAVLEEIEEIYQKLSSMVKGVILPDQKDGFESIKVELSDTAEKLNQLIHESDLVESQQSTFEKILKAIRMGSFRDLLDKGLKNPPVLKPRDAETHPGYQEILRQWKKVGELIRKYARIYAVRYYIPYLKAYEAFRDVLERTKREEGIIFIDDINKKLSDYLDREIIPDVYFGIGETIAHYLMDEFQDTSPIQWGNLRPLIENSLAEGGSFFAVGDTKQAIYGFRDADYRIMRSLESLNPFPSAHHEVKELQVNYRSLEGIVKFNEMFFKKVVTAHGDYREAAERSGLTDYFQRVKEGHEGLGYAEVRLCEKDDEEPPEKAELQTLIRDLRERGYLYSDIGILTHQNEDVVNLTTWLNEMDVPFISYSSLDIRRRKLTEEVFFLLTFLDSPPDDLSFSGFLLGEIFRGALTGRERGIELEKLRGFLFRNRKRRPLYKLFQKEFPDLWEDYFDGLFRSTGYLPLYDLVSEIYRVFEVFKTFREEEATLVKILEVIKNFEREGMNNPGDFLRLARDEVSGETEWNIDVPAGINAVHVMTIHKVKGLGFPVVILILYGEQSRAFKYIINEKEDGVVLLKINRDSAKANDLLRKAYEEERIKERVNRLNTLYVGFTRPESELYVIGVSGKRRQFPIDLLGEVEIFPLEKKGPFKTSKAVHQDYLQLHHFTREVDFTSLATLEELNIEERRRGEFIHRILYFIEYLDEDLETRLEEVIREVMHDSNLEYPVDPIRRELMEFFLHQDVRPYFNPKPGRVIRREQDFSDPEGNLLRMDRVIIDEDRVMVMDYKTGGEKKTEERHISQLRNYMRVLKDLYPDKEIEGMIAYTDLKEGVRIGRRPF